MVIQSEVQFQTVLPYNIICDGIKKGNVPFA
jgi:hypothetical protein